MRSDRNVACAVARHASRRSMYTLAVDRHCPWHLIQSASRNGEAPTTRSRSTGMGVRRIAAVALAGIAPATSPAMAQSTFPSKTSQVVIQSKYGGRADTTARMTMIRSRRDLAVDMQVVTKHGGSNPRARRYREDDAGRSAQSPCVFNTRAQYA